MDGIDTSSVAAGFRPASTTASAKPAALAQPADSLRSNSLAPTADVFALLADASPPIDTKKVEAIRSLIAQGRYPIDERAIAAKMIALDVRESR